jgi:hypothetical protein
MRFDLSRIREIDRSVVLTVVALLASIGISAWLVRDVSRRESDLQILGAEVSQTEAQVAGLPRQTASPLSEAELKEKTVRLVGPAGSEEELRAQLSSMAADHNLQNVKIDYKATTVDAANTDPANLLLQALSVQRYIDISIDFKADYIDAARFLDSVEKLPQKVLVRSADIRRDKPQVSGSLHLRIYQKGSQG